jgi:hypothetical protein
VTDELEKGLRGKIRGREPIKVLLQNLLGNTVENQEKTSARIDGVTAEIRTEHLLSLERYH